MFSKTSFVAAFIFLGATIIDGQSLPTLNSLNKGRLLTPLEGCGLTKIRTTKIVGGTYAKEGAWPWIAAIGYYDMKIGYRFRCGGTLITSRHVITAGHCIRDDVRIVFVRLGALNRYAKGDGPHKDINVVHTKRHPYYEISSGTDVGMLFLGHDVEFNDRIRPICVPINEPIKSQSFVGTNPFVAGWGRTVENATEGSDLLKQLQVPVHENALCVKLYRKKRVDEIDFPDDVICAGNLAGGDGICNGDSGGPLMLPIQQNGNFPFYLIGVVSFSIDCGHKNSPDGYVNVPYHSDWIQDIIENGNKNIE